eukprot:TRINITY_DN51426_c0_g1_i1.p1 TRINITY_DN51426_c0_g1~~TRINITY_DN51426_c0_g1_i1.p1  ORF type:complete len:101 (-),score=9.53 TRINITY_DN51426_c0_g1_i1:151-453(-)
MIETPFPPASLRVPPSLTLFGSEHLFYWRIKEEISIDVKMFRPKQSERWWDSQRCRRKRCLNHSKCCDLFFLDLYPIQGDSNGTKRGTSCEISQSGSNAS